jgi:hypothetical protein
MNWIFNLLDFEISIDDLSLFDDDDRISVT